MDRLLVDGNKAPAVITTLPGMRRIVKREIRIAPAPAQVQQHQCAG
jgi:hypothetical protein